MRAGRGPPAIGHQRGIVAAVADAGEARRVWVNVVDDAHASSVQVPARVERGPVQIAISSGGSAPMLARHLREQLEIQLDASLGELATLLADERGRIRTRYPDIGERRRSQYAYSQPVGREVERCSERIEQSYEERIDGYDVEYEYGGQVFHTRLPYDPGERIRVRVAVTPA